MTTETPTAPLPSGMWTPDGYPSLQVVAYSRSILERAMREGRDEVVISGIRWTFTPMTPPTGYLPGMLHGTGGNNLGIREPINHVRGPWCSPRCSHNWTPFPYDPDPTGPEPHTEGELA